MKVVKFPLVVLVHKYVSSRRQRRAMSKETAYNVEATLRRFAETAPADASKVTYRHVEGFVHQPQYAASTRRRMLSELRGFFRWAVIEGHVKKDPTLQVAAVEQPPTVPSALGRDQAEVVHVNHVHLEPRVRLMLSLELNEALRRVELARALVPDIDRRGAVMRVRGKARGGAGDVTGTVPLSAPTLDALGAYLSSEPAILGVPSLASGPLFRNRRNPNRPLRKETIGRIVTGALYELGLKQAPHDGVAGHALRHTAAVESLEAGVPIEKVQRFLRHKHSATTDHYTRGAVFDLRVIHEARGTLRTAEVIDLTEA